VLERVFPEDQCVNDPDRHYSNTNASPCQCDLITPPRIARRIAVYVRVDSPTAPWAAPAYGIVQPPSYLECDEYRDSLQEAFICDRGGHANTTVNNIETAQYLASEGFELTTAATILVDFIERGYTASDLL
jgi:hypothetical protein